MEANFSMYSELSKIAKIATSKVSMYSINDKYSHPPFFRFRFENYDKDDSLYVFLENIITDFQGNLRWSLHTKSDSINFLIIPSVFTDDVKDDFYNKNFYIEKYSLHIYQKFIDDAIEDIPLLAKYISLTHFTKMES